MAINEWLLLGMITLYTLSFVNYVVIGTFILIMGRKGDKSGLVSRYEFWSQLIYAVIGVLTLLLVMVHGISAFELQRRQLQISSAQHHVCNKARRTCFTSQNTDDFPSMDLCDFLTMDSSDDTNGLCADDSEFVVNKCEIFGQDVMTAADVISFGQYRFGGYSLSLIHI